MSQNGELDNIPKIAEAPSFLEEMYKKYNI